MNRTEKAGWLALGLSFLAVLLGAITFNYLGPGATDRQIILLSRPEIREAVFSEANRLFDSLPNDTTIFADDARVRHLNSAIAPSRLSFVFKERDSLLIECGGGFRHYGFILRITPDGVRTLFLQDDGKPDRELIKNEPNNAVELTPASVTPPADAGAAPLASVAHLGR